MPRAIVIHRAARGALRCSRAAQRRGIRRGVPHQRRTWPGWWSPRELPETPRRALACWLLGRGETFRRAVPPQVCLPPMPGEHPGIQFWYNGAATSPSSPRGPRRMRNYERRRQHTNETRRARNEGLSQGLLPSMHQFGVPPGAPRRRKRDDRRAPPHRRPRPPRRRRARPRLRRPRRLAPPTARALTTTRPSAAPRA